MPGSADAIQGAIHALESGGAAVWVRRALTTALIAGLSLFYLLHEFRGLATSQAMDHAQIGRALLQGHGWQTNFARPLVAGQLERRGKNVAQKIWIDTFEAPLPPLLDAIALLPVKSHLKMSTQDVIYLGDRMIALTSILLFLASIGVLFFVVRRLFDQTVALVSCVLILIGDIFWQYALSGLPQMLLLLLFCLTTYALVRAFEEEMAERPPARWLVFAGVGFGLLALAHGLTIWIFLPALIFCALYFRSHLWTMLCLLAPFAILYLPWLIRNYLVCGNPLGAAFYSLFDQVGLSGSGHMRQLSIDLQGMNLGSWRNKFTSNFTQQTGQLFRHFGWNPIALCFFPAVLHRFRRSLPAMIRFVVLAMWLGAVAGMTVYGIDEELGVGANQLHLLFVPIMTSFGLAYLLVQWSRLEISSRLARLGFFALLFLLCGWPMLFNLLLGSTQAEVRWPPYAPPYISVLNDWMRPNEITASDMPWAIAWYADRRAVWLPETLKDYTELSDYQRLGGPINGIYLTPISGSQNNLRDILKGEYKDWSGVILRSVDLQKFPLKWATLLGLENECVFFSDQNRQAASPSKK